MQSLNEKTWGAVQVDSFADVMSGKDIYASERVDGERPYVTAGTANNGIGYFVGNDNNSVDSHVISVNRNGAVGEAFFHPYKALFGNDCRRLKVRESVADDAQQFMAVAIKEQKGAFSYSRKLGTGRLQRLSVMLPVTDSGEPDYAYMAEYVQQTRDAMLAKYRAYVKARIAELGEVAEIPALDEKDWHDFRIGDLFGISRPVARNKDNYLPGDVPFIASGSINNGVMKLCEPLEDEQLDDGCCITVSPVDGSTFFQPMNFLGRGGAGSSIMMLRCEGLNLYRGQFMARTIQQTCSKYTYGHMGNKDSIKRERIMLPVTDSGEPDYEYMEQYAKNMMFRKYRQYLAYLDRQKQWQE